MQAYTWGTDEAIAAVVAAVKEPHTMDLNAADARAFADALAGDDIDAQSIGPDDMRVTLLALVSSGDERANDLAGSIAESLCVEWI